MPVQTLVRRTLAGLIIIVGSVALLGLAALADGWTGLSISPAFHPWILSSPLPALWTAAIILWTLVLVAGLLHDDGRPRIPLNETATERWTELDDLAYRDDRTFVRLGRGRAEPILHVSDRRRRGGQEHFVA